MTPGFRSGRLRRQSAGCPRANEAVAPDCPARDALALEVLVREEAEHRSANLIQLVAANLDRAARAVDGSARLALDAASVQINILGRLHLEQARHPSGVETCGVRAEVLGAQLSALVLRPRGHALLLDVASDVAPIRLVPPVARCLDLIVVEAVINAAKHAFPEGPGGQVTVHLCRAARQLSCSIVDDGTGGLAAAGREGSRGMGLINALARQVGGHCQWTFGQSGTGVHVLLPVTDAELASCGGSVRSGNPHAGIGIPG